jgi:hypothetical protein
MLAARCLAGSHTPASAPSICALASAYVSIRQRTSAYVHLCSCGGLVSVGGRGREGGRENVYVQGREGVRVCDALVRLCVQRCDALVRL